MFLHRKLEFQSQGNNVLVSSVQIKYYSSEYPEHNGIAFKTIGELGVEVLLLAVHIHTIFKCKDAEQLFV